MIGIWQWMSDLAANASIEEWEIEVCVHQEHTYILRPTGAENPVEQVLVDIHSRPKMITQEERNSFWHITVPIFFDKKLVFYWKLISLEKIETPILSKWRQELELWVRDEARIFLRYPSFIPFVLPFDEGVFHINKVLTQKKKYFFLNGQVGTGKHVFIQNYLLYHYRETLFTDQLDRSLPLSEFTFYDRTAVSGVIVHELGLLDPGEMMRLEEIVDQTSQDVIFICSAYDPEILLSREIITPKIFEILMGNRVLFPSPQRRVSGAITALQYYVSLKVGQEPGLMHMEWLKLNISRYSFADILTALHADMQPIGAISEMIDAGENLRDIVAKIEYDAIHYAQRVVGSSQNKIAKLLGISRGSLQHKLKKYNFPYHEWEE